MSPVIKIAAIAIASTALMGATSTANMGTTTFKIPLSGQAESNIAHPAGGTGDPGGSGSVRLSITPAMRKVCYDFSLSGVSDPMMAHIHRGAPLSNGPPVVILFVGTKSRLESCVASTHGQLADIVADPADYYVSVDTPDFPDGALRGQLRAG